MPIRIFTRPSESLSPADGRAVFIGIAFAIVLLAPVRHYRGDKAQVDRAKDARDSFPISTYPMFTANREGSVIVPHVVGFTAKGKRIPLHYRHFGAGGLNQVRKQISRAVRRGDALNVAQQYADSLATQPRKRERRVVEVAVVRSRFIFDDYFGTEAGEDPGVANREPHGERVHARCLVGGTAEAYEPQPLPSMRRQGTDPS